MDIRYSTADLPSHINQTTLTPPHIHSIQTIIKKGCCEKPVSLRVIRPTKDQPLPRRNSQNLYPNVSTKNSPNNAGDNATRTFNVMLIHTPYTN